MKKIISIGILTASLAIIIAACGGGKTETKPTLTIENLKASINGETTASLKYAAFAQKAAEEGFPQIEKLFEATSKSGSIQAANHQKVLEGLGEKFLAKTDTFTVKTTKENLEAALKVEKHEAETIYPGYVTQGSTDKVDDAVKSFGWARDTEASHIKLYQAALDALNSEKTETLSMEYYICPKCGEIYHPDEVKEKCDICGTGEEKYILIK